MHVVRVEWGFCGCLKHERQLHVDQLIPSEGLVRADQFIEWVFLADDMNPNIDPERWSRQKAAICTAFIKHMGGDAVDVAGFAGATYRTNRKSLMRSSAVGLANGSNPPLFSHFGNVRAFNLSVRPAR